MIRTNGAFDDPKELNVLQIVVINIAATVSLLAFGLALGATWPTALIGAWIAGAVVTMGGAVALYYLRDRRTKETAMPSDSPALVPGNVSEPLQLWEADRLMELDHASAILGSGRARATPTEKFKGSDTQEADARSSHAASDATGQNKRGDQRHAG